MCSKYVNIYATDNYVYGTRICEVYLAYITMDATTHRKHLVKEIILWIRKLRYRDFNICLSVLIIVTKS